MRSGITAVMIAIGVLFLSAGLMLFIAPLFWNSGIGYEGTYMLRDCVREVIGKGIAIDDDSSIALALILIFQGIRLMERRNRSIGSLLYSLWLLIPALLAISTLDSAPGSLPRLLSSILPGDPPAPLFLSMILTILFGGRRFPRLARRRRPALSRLNWRSWMRFPSWQRQSLKP